MRVRWVDPATGDAHELNAAVVYVFSRNRDLDVAVLQALPTAGAALSLRMRLWHVLCLHEAVMISLSSFRFVHHIICNLSISSFRYTRLSQSCMGGVTSTELRQAAVLCRVQPSFHWSILWSHPA